MAAEKKVVDASIMAKWFLNEPDSGKAIKLLDEHIAGKVLLVVPELAFLEVLNALRYKGKNAGSLSKANSALWEAQLHIEKLNSFLLDKSIQMALKYNLSLYDAVYAALANILGVSFVTADKTLQRVPNAELLR